MFGEWIDAKLPISNKVKIPKGGSQWFSGVYLGKDTEADEVILGNANGVVKVCTVRRKPHSQQWNAVGVSKMLSVPWQPKGDGVDSTALLQNDGSDRVPAETVHEPPDLGENAQGLIQMLLRLSL